MAKSEELHLSYYVPSGGALATRPSVLAELNAAGVGVFVYTINSANDWKSLAELGVDGVITDRPGAFIGWKEAQAQIEPVEPTVAVVAPTDGGSVERGDDFVVAAATTDADELTLTLDGEPVENGASMPAATLALGEHTVIATAVGAGGEATATTTFTVTVTPEGLKERLVQLDVTLGQLRRLLNSLDAQNWDRLTAAIEQYVTDPATKAELLEEVAALAG